MNKPSPITALPSHLLAGYRHWQNTEHTPNRSHYETLAEGQHPPVMMLSCCDSRVEPSAIFNTQSGGVFTHRTIANLIPEFSTDGVHCGTVAAIEFAVNALKVSHIVVMGHSACGGIHHGYHTLKEREGRGGSDGIGGSNGSGGGDGSDGSGGLGLPPSSSIYHWLQVLRPAFETLPKHDSDDDNIAALEKHAIVVSLKTLLTYPFVIEAVQSGELQLHGLWYDIATGTLLAYNPDAKIFEAVE